MSTTKKGFLKAGSILAIVLSVFMLLTGLSLIPASTIVNEDFVLDTYTVEPGYTKYVDVDGSYYIEYFEDEDDLHPTKVTDDEIQLIAKITKVVIIVISVAFIGFSIAQFIIALLLLKKTNKNITSKALIITLLVLSVLSGSFVTLAFMIVALCIKDKKVTLENVNEIANENQETQN